MYSVYSDVLFQCNRHQYFLFIMICSINVSPSQLTCPARNISPLRREQDPRSHSVRSLTLFSHCMLALFGGRFIFYSWVTLILFSHTAFSRPSP